MRRRTVLAAALAAALACGPGGDAGDRDRAPADPSAVPAAPDAPTGRTAGDAAGPPPAGRDAPAETLPVARPASGGTPGEWTAGIVEVEPAGDGVPIQRAVRAARHDGFDRIVLELSDGRPGVHAEYVDEPVRLCGSGRPVALPGDGWLEVRLRRAAAHEGGESTLDRRRLAPGLPAVREIVLTCDFEGGVTWVAAVAVPEPYRVLVLEDPTRIVVDVRHPGP